MKNALLAACVIALLLVVGWTGYGQKQNPSRVTWEYKVKTEQSIPNSSVSLTTLGNEGWELTAVTTREEPMSNSQVNIITTYYLKRQR